MDTNFFGKDGFIWWKGVVEDRKDPIFLGRVRVRIFGWHTDDKTQIPTTDLPWAMPSLPIDNGRNPVGLKEGDWCWGFFLDGTDAQKPVVVGYIPGIDESPADPSKGFYDPTSVEELEPGSIPRPPDMGGSIPVTTYSEASSRYSGEKVPGTNIAFGELAEDFDITKSKFDVNKNGEFDQDDVSQLIENSLTNDEFFNGFVESSIIQNVSSYPLENRLNEPSTSRLSRNEKIEETIVAYKTQKLTPGEGAGFSGNTMGGVADAPTSFIEPPTPYAAQYPYNHVYESESGHVLEVDDTPGAERLHRYHRSGTFNEVHPDGVEVNRIVNSQYNIIYNDYYNSTGFTYNVDAKTGIRMKSGANFNVQTSGNLNEQVGADNNSAIGGNETTHIGGNSGSRVSGNKIEVTEGNKIIRVNGTSNTRIDSTNSSTIAGEDWINVADGVYINCSNGPIHVKADADVLVESTSGKIQLVASESIDLIAPKVNIKTAGAGNSTFDKFGFRVLGPIHSLGLSTLSVQTINTLSTNVTAGVINSNIVSSPVMFANVYTGDLVGVIAPGPIIPVLPSPVVPVVAPIVITPETDMNNAGNNPDQDKLDEEQNNIEETLSQTISSGDGGPKYGIFIPNGVTGDVYKPVSDSNGNLVTLSATIGSHELREALPTAELETVLIKYEDPSGKITEWTVVRPVHVPGALIDTPTKTDMFEDGVRQLARWSKPGREYPKQMFWVVNGRAMLILDSAERHQCKFGPYNDKV